LVTIDIAEIAAGGAAQLASKVASTRDIEAIAWSRDGQVLYGAGGDNIYKYDFAQKKWIFSADTGISEAIEGMDIDLVKSQSAGADVLILGPHNKSRMYYWNVSTKKVIDSIPTAPYEDIEGIVTCRVN
jgi:WD40 repeat protein